MAAYTIDGKLRTIGGKAAIDVDCCECECCMECGVGDVPTTATVTMTGLTGANCNCPSYNTTYVVPLSLTELCRKHEGSVSFSVDCTNNPPADTTFGVRVTIELTGDTSLPPPCRTGVQVTATWGNIFGIGPPSLTYIYTDADCITGTYGPADVVSATGGYCGSIGATMTVTIT